MLRLAIPCLCMIFAGGTPALAQRFGSDTLSETLSDTFKVTAARSNAVNEWTWMGGSSTANQPGVYGELGKSAAGNIPGSRYDAARWTDNSGNFWLFGGTGFDVNGNLGALNDFWKFSLSTNEWTWMGGSSTTFAASEYGEMGVPALGNIPGGRVLASSAKDGSGNFWLFGGWGVDAYGTFGELNDLWKFNPLTGEWTWMSGSSTLYEAGSPEAGVYGKLGVAGRINRPGGRASATSWIDDKGNLWLFGGYIYPEGYYFNDLWEFRPLTGEWAWMGGSSTSDQPGVYGTLEKAAAGNIPGARENAASWTDSNGNLWLFGGAGKDSKGNQGDLNDLWEFNPVTGEWAWMGGGNTANQAAVYGALGKTAAGNIPGARTNAVSWTDSGGNFWLFSGWGLVANNTTEPYGTLNDFWKFSPLTNEWAWMGGSNSTNPPGVYGILATPAAANIPGGRELAASWTDGAGNLWLFGGEGETVSPGTMSTATTTWFRLNDLWRYEPPTGLSPTATPTFSLAAGNYSKKQSVAIKSATEGATIYYTTDGATPTTGSARYTAEITVDSSQTIRAMASAPQYSNSDVAAVAFTIRDTAKTSGLGDSRRHVAARASRVE
jgi:N-acetylneuraminic acid mutarotase